MVLSIIGMLRYSHEELPCGVIGWFERRPRLVPEVFFVRRH